MTQEAWRHLQVQLSRYSETITKIGEDRLRRLLEEHAKKAVASYNFDAAGYAKEMERIITQVSELPAAKAQAIADRALEDAMIKAGVKGEAEREMLKKKLYAESGSEVPVGKYMSKPDGTVVFVPPERELEFISKYDLSGIKRPLQVWKIGDLCQKAAYDKQQEIMGIVRQGVADGIDAKDIARDLEAHINGKIIKGRWGHLKPDKEFDALVDKLIAEEGYTPAGARSMAGKIYKENGWERASGSREYYARFGAAGIDYRAARLLRSEQSAALNNRQKEIALNNPAVDNRKVEIVLEQNRDAWNCFCEEFARASKGGKILGDDGYLHEDNGNIVVAAGNASGEKVGIPPYHPNCFCDCRPVLLSEEAFQKKILEKYHLR
ncbi:hypothetical protein FACS1894151_08170 [Spirochaetia bacterium]|nr:hypothetical protein FACS1894151_08170 [Spirochaetia bacterium]